MDEGFHILSLDGGGIRGLFSAAVLAAIESDLRVNVADYFDLIVGASTGGIIALGLGLGLAPAQIVDFYFERGRDVFQDPFRARSALRLVRSKYQQRKLLNALRAEDVFGDRLLGDSDKRLVIPTYNLGSNEVYIFKTPHDERLRRDWKVPAWQVGLATSAAPTYFPVVTNVDRLRLVDGGMWATNPVLVGIVEALSVLRVPLERIRVLSLGTTEEVSCRPRRLDCGGLISWARPALGILLSAQSTAAHNFAVHLVGETNVVRLNPKVPEGIFGLDTVGSRDQLMAQAAHESRKLMPLIEAGFMRHQAKPYVPAVEMSS